MKTIEENTRKALCDLYNENKDLQDIVRRSLIGKTTLDELKELLAKSWGNIQKTSIEIEKQGELVLSLLCELQNGLDALGSELAKIRAEDQRIDEVIKNSGIDGLIAKSNG